MNSARQTAFLGDLTGTDGGSNDDLGMYHHGDLLGLTQVARCYLKYFDVNDSPSALSREQEDSRNLKR